MFLRIGPSRQSMLDEPPLSSDEREETLCHAGRAKPCTTLRVKKPGDCRPRRLQAGKGSWPSERMTWPKNHLPREPRVSDFRGIAEGAIRAWKNPLNFALSYEANRPIAVCVIPESPRCS